MWPVIKFPRDNVSTQKSIVLLTFATKKRAGHWIRFRSPHPLLRYFVPQSVHNESFFIKYLVCRGCLIIIWTYKSRHSSKSIWVTNPVFCQNDSPIRRLFWQLDLFLVHCHNHWEMCQMKRVYYGSSSSIIFNQNARNSKIIRQISSKFSHLLIPNYTNSLVNAYSFYTIDCSEMKENDKWLFPAIVFGNYVTILHKTEVQTVILRCLMGLNIDWFKIYGLWCTWRPRTCLANFQKIAIDKWSFYKHIWSFFGQLCVDLSKNWDPDGHFEVLNKSES